MWAKFKPDCREGNNPGYIALQDHWLAEILPVSPHTRSTGAATSLSATRKPEGRSGAWEGKAPDPYYQDLYDNARKYGIEIPFFMSGYHHGTSPVLENPDNGGCTCPWISTETWTGWYANYGAAITNT